MDAKYTDIGVNEGLTGKELYDKVHETDDKEQVRHDHFGKESHRW